MEEVKPCPFCGQMPYLGSNAENYDNEECLFHKFTWTNAWNMRPIEDALQAKIAKLKKEQDDSNNLAHYLYFLSKGVAETMSTEIKVLNELVDALLDDNETLVEATFNKLNKIRAEK